MTDPIISQFLEPLTFDKQTCLLLCKACELAAESKQEAKEIFISLAEILQEYGQTDSNQQELFSNHKFYPVLARACELARLSEEMSRDSNSLRILSSLFKAQAKVAFSLEKATPDQLEEFQKRWQKTFETIPPSLRKFL